MWRARLLALRPREAAVVTQGAGAVSLNVTLKCAQSFRPHWACVVSHSAHQRRAGAEAGHTCWVGDTCESFLKSPRTQGRSRVLLGLVSFAGTRRWSVRCRWHLQPPSRKGLLPEGRLVIASWSSQNLFYFSELQVGCHVIVLHRRCPQLPSPCTLIPSAKSPLSPGSTGTEAACSMALRCPAVPGPCALNTLDPGRTSSSPALTSQTCFPFTLK